MTREDRYLRLRENATFRNGGMATWSRACIAVIGCGTLGSRLAPEIVRSGAQVWVCDFDQVATHNLGTQAVQPGLSKVDAVVRACESIRPGAATGVCADFRHIGVNKLRSLDLFIDCTDDARLVSLRTTIANGLLKPQVRVAVDGTGQRELGRVLCSDSRDGGGCELCTYAAEDFTTQIERVRCPGTAPGRPATHAGGALASTMTGVALLQAQRLITGNDRELAQNREVLVDLTHFELMAARLNRSSKCLSGHTPWELVELDRTNSSCVGQVFDEIAGTVGDQSVALEPFGHPLCLLAVCHCGMHRVTPGTVWATAPECRRCGAPMTWQTETQVALVHRRQAEELNLLARSLRELGIPDGAMFVAHLPEGPPVRFVLSTSQ